VVANINLTNKYHSLNIKITVTEIALLEQSLTAADGTEAVTTAVQIIITYSKQCQFIYWRQLNVRGAIYLFIKNDFRHLVKKFSDNDVSRTESGMDCSKHLGQHQRLASYRRLCCSRSLPQLYGLSDDHQPRNNPE